MAFEKQSTERVKLAKQVELQDIRERIVQLLIPTTTHQDLLRIPTTTHRKALLRQLFTVSSNSVSQCITSFVTKSTTRNKPAFKKS